MRRTLRAVEDIVVDSPDAAGRADTGPRTLTLRSAARTFSAYGSPRWMGLVAGGAVVARIALGHFSLADLVVAASILVIEPFAEWVLHVFVLHLRPHTIAGRTIDPLFARRHRMHHRDPRDVRLVFVPLPVLAGFFLGLGAVGGLAFPDHRLGLTAFATMTTFLFGYEWSHFLIHSTYVPRSAVFRAVWRAHILHHYKNEQYWFGVTNPIADYVLRTHPAKDAVPTSPTARTLGVDDELTLLGATG